MEMTGGLGGPARFPQSLLVKEDSSFSEEKAGPALRDAKRLYFLLLFHDA
jgi:hypothetical protein